MNNQMVSIFDELVEAKVDQMLEQEHFESTPFKSSEQIKEEHRQRLVQSLQVQEIRNDLTQAINLIFQYLPESISREKFDKIKTELDEAVKHFIEFYQNQVEERVDTAQPVLLKEICGISNQTLMDLYDFSKRLIEKREYENGRKVLMFLTTLAPHIEGYWIVLGLCHEALNKHEDAIEFYNIAKILNPEDLIPFVYSADVYNKLGKKEEAQNEMDQFKKLKR